MNSRWSDPDAAGFVERYGARWGEDLALRTYTARLLGAEPTLVLHGGGNSSVKGTRTNVFGEPVAAVFVKASGRDMASIDPEAHPGLDLERLCRLRDLTDLTDEAMINELRTHLFEANAPTPSIETLVHAFLPFRFIDHTHADAILALTNQANGGELVREALGDEVIVLDYVVPGFRLARVAAEAIERGPGATGMVWMHHGLLTWGESAQEAYESHIELVVRAEAYLDRKAAPAASAVPSTPVEVARERWERVAPVLRGVLAERVDDPDRPFRRVILAPLIREDVLDFVDSDRGKQLALTPPLTTDHLIRTKALPLWIDDPVPEDTDALRSQLEAAVRHYAVDYEAYCARHAEGALSEATPFDPHPRVVLLPGIGAVGAGANIVAAGIARDIAAHTLAVKTRIAAMGTYEGLGEEHLHAMEYRTMQRAKLDREELPLGRQVALVTGAAGAIGSGVCRELLVRGCHVAVTDLAGDHLEGFVEGLRPDFGERVIGVPLDVTDAGSVAAAFRKTASTWGGVDLIIANAGVAHVSALVDLDMETFRRIERINVDGTLTVLAAAARHFKLQGTGGDVVLVSTKNVFAPGATFGAYSATKAAAHQLARIASLELAGMGVRVNMVSPDAVFGEADRRSGLWEEVGPDRMKARGLDRDQLEEYYRKRNLLQARVTARHVANAVLFFATRQTPTTGATIPVDGGLPDSTPR